MAKRINNCRDPNKLLKYLNVLLKVSPLLKDGFGRIVFYSHLKLNADKKLTRNLTFLLLKLSKKAPLSRSYRRSEVQNLVLISITVSVNY